MYSVPGDRGNKYLKKTIGELKVGDIICGGDGKPTEVIHLNPIIIEDVYEVEFEDGEIIECNAEHLWVVKKKEIMELVETSYLCSYYQRHEFGIKKQYSVPCVTYGKTKLITKVHKTTKKKAMRCITA